MDWLPYRDEIIAEMERVVLKYNPDWSGVGFEKYKYKPGPWIHIQLFRFFFFFFYLGVSTTCIIIYS